MIKRTPQINTDLSKYTVKNIKKQLDLTKRNTIGKN